MRDGFPKYSSSACPAQLGRRAALKITVISLKPFLIFSISMSSHFSPPVSWAAKSVLSPSWFASMNPVSAGAGAARAWAMSVDDRKTGSERRTRVVSIVEFR